MAALTISRLLVPALGHCRRALRERRRAIPPRRRRHRCHDPGQSLRRATRPRQHPRPSTNTMSDAKTESAPETGAAPLDRINGLGSLGFDHLGLAGADRDLARLFRLGDFAHEIDVQEPVLEGRTLDLDIIGELEDALERTRCDALIEHLTAVLLVLRLFLAFDRQRVLLRFDRKFVFAEARHSKRNAVGVVAGPLDVVGRITRSSFEAVQHGEQPVETDGRTIEGSKIESSHGITSLVERNADGPPSGPDRFCFRRSPREACATRIWGGLRATARALTA